MTAWVWAETPASEQRLRFLYPIGKVYKTEAIVPLVIELSNPTSRPVSYDVSWSLDTPLPEELTSAQLKPGDIRRFPLYLPRHRVSQLYNIKVDGISYSPEMQVGSRSLIAAILSPAEEKFDYLRSLKLEYDANAAYNNTAQHTAAPGESAAKPSAAWTTLTNLSNLEPELFPENGVLLSSLDTIVVYDLPALSLSQRQKQALLDWCCLGGRLVLVSDGAPDEYRGTPFEPYLPLQPREVVNVDGLALLSGPLDPKAVTSSRHQGRPLLVSRPLANGEIFLLTAPLKQLAPLTVEHSEKLWRQVFSPDAPGNAAALNSYPKRPNFSGGSGTLRDIPELPRAQAGWLALYLLCYALLVGPVNLSYLRRKDKMLWSFVSVPAIALFFAGGAYLLNLANRSSVPLLRELGTVHFRSGDRVGVGSADALFFSPSARKYELDSPPGAVCHPGAYSYTDRTFELYRQLPDGGLQGVIQLSTWDIFSLQMESVFHLSAPIKGGLDGELLSVNSSLSSAPGEALVYHSKLGVSAPFTLASGEQTHQLRMAAGKTYDAFSAISGTTEEHPGRDQLLANLSSSIAQTFKPDTAYLLFWTDELKSPVKVTDSTVHKAEYLVVVELDS